MDVSALRHEVSSNGCCCPLSGSDENLSGLIIAQGVLVTDSREGTWASCISARQETQLRSFKENFDLLYLKSSSLSLWLTVTPKDIVLC